MNRPQAMNGEQAWALVREHVHGESLRRHLLGVEAAMRGYARHWQSQGEAADEEAYALAGLLHDFDYEAHANEHPAWGVRYLREHTDTPEAVLDAILGHAGLAPRVSLLSRTLYAVDETAGLVQAAALVRPQRDLAGLTLSSVQKRFKNRAFAAAVSREDIAAGAAELGVPLDEHLSRVLAAMQAGESSAQATH